MHRYIVTIKTSIIIIIHNIISVYVLNHVSIQVYLLIYNEFSKLKIWVDIKKYEKNLKVSNTKKKHFVKHKY